MCAADLGNHGGAALTRFLELYPQLERPFPALTNVDERRRVINLIIRETTPEPRDDGEGTRQGKGKNKGEDAGKGNDKGNGNDQALGRSRLSVYTLLGWPDVKLSQPSRVV